MQTPTITPLRPAELLAGSSRERGAGAVLRGSALPDGMPVARAR